MYLYLDLNYTTLNIKTIIFISVIVKSLKKPNESAAINLGNAIYKKQNIFLKIFMQLPISQSLKYRLISRSDQDKKLCIYLVKIESFFPNGALTEYLSDVRKICWWIRKISGSGFYDI